MDIKEEALLLQEKGLSLMQIGQKLNISKTTAFNYIKDAKANRLNTHRKKVKNKDEKDSEGSSGPSVKQKSEKIHEPTGASNILGFFNSEKAKDLSAQRGDIKNAEGIKDTKTPIRDNSFKSYPPIYYPDTVGGQSLNYKTSSHSRIGYEILKLLFGAAFAFSIGYTIWSNKKNNQKHC